MTANLKIILNKAEEKLFLTVETILRESLLMENFRASAFLNLPHIITKVSLRMESTTEKANIHGNLEMFMKEIMRKDRRVDMGSIKV